MTTQDNRVSSGVTPLDQLLGGLYIGDNVIWYDDAGSLAAVFYLNFIRASKAQGNPLIYVSFDRSPRNLLDKLGPLAETSDLTILDCFTSGKGAGSEVFMKFYENDDAKWPCRILRVEDPRNVHEVMDAFYGVHDTLDGEVHFVFESLTGMQELWGGEEHIVNFYSHSCPRLYELQTIAYWIIEKQAHSQRLRARINQIAQVAIDLSVRRGKTSLTILKAEKRSLETLNKPHVYWSKDLDVRFEFEKRTGSRFDLGTRLRDLRSRQGISQTKLAKMVGVTPSTISQIESNLIYPSLPALFKIAEVLSVEVGTLFQEPGGSSQNVFSSADAVEIKFPDLPRDSLIGKRLIPLDYNTLAEPFLIEIPAGSSLPAHFFLQKGDELGFVLSGALQMKVNKSTVRIEAGELIYLTTDIPTQWSNPGPEPAKILWIKLDSTLG